jgi:hypothetical protein
MFNLMTEVLDDPSIDSEVWWNPVGILERVKLKSRLLCGIQSSLAK